MTEFSSKDLSRKQLFKSLFFGLVGGSLICVVVLLIASVVLSKSNMPQNTTNIVADATVVISSFAAGFIATKIFGKRGLLIGCLTGITFYLFLFLVSVIFFRSPITVAALTKLVMMTASSTLGGIIAVNFRRRRRYK